MTESRRLRSNFEPGTTRWAMRRAQWTALGLTPQDMEKPKVAIVNSWSAKVYRSRDHGVAAISRGEVRAGDVLVLTGLGLRGAPGMGFTSAFVFALDGAGLSGKVAMITDGQMSGLVNEGTSVAEVSPEGAVGGPIGLVEDGDIISVDLEARTIELDVPQEELARRRERLRPLEPPAGCGWLSVYAWSVRPLRQGATLGG